MPSPQELVEKVCPKINEGGWAYYFEPETAARGEALGIDLLTFYFLGRGGVLGDVEWQVVHSAFGYFNPDVVQRMWTSGKEKVSPRAAGRAYVECCQDLGRRKLADVPGLEAFCAAGEAVNAAADPVGLPLYAGLSSEPLAEDPPGRAMQLVAILRELRGGAHLLAVVASGLRPAEAHYLHRPEAWTMFGWAEEATPAVTDETRAKLAAAERLTDELVLPAYSAVDDAGAAALLEGMAAIEAALSA